MSAKNVAFPGSLAAKTALGLPQTATANLFSNTGTILVTGIAGVVTTACGATVTTLSLGTVAGAGGSATTIATATAITSAAAGTWLTIPSVGGALTVKAGGAVTVAGSYLLTPFLLAANANITWTTSASDTGNVTWYLWYIPIDSSVAVS